MSDISIDGQRENVTLRAMQEVGKDEQQELAAEQLTSKQNFIDSQKETVNPFATKLAPKQKDIKAQKARVQKMKETTKGKKVLKDDEALKDFAEHFKGQRDTEDPYADSRLHLRNELRSDVLVVLRNKIKPGDTKEEILQTLSEFYHDVSVANEALTFLAATTDGELAETVKEAKKEFEQLHSKQIILGLNIAIPAQEAASKGLGTAESMRDMFREILGNPRDSTTLFDELSTKYSFKDLKKVVDFLLHSLGADMKAKGPSIPKGLLHRLFTETRSLQAILGVYRFFKGRTRLTEKMFNEQSLPMPAELSFESMAKQFMSLASERYPSSAKVSQTAIKMGIEGQVSAKIIVYSQMRDAVKEVAMNLIFKSVQHRDEMYLAILETLEDLEDQLEDLMDKEDNISRG